MQRLPFLNLWAALSAVLLISAASVFAGCDRPAISQSSSAPTAAAVALPAESPQADAALEVKPAVDQSAVSEPPATFAAAPADDGPPRRSAIRPKADRGTTTDGVEKITFDDLILGMQADMVYRPWMLESETNGGRAKELEGKRVRLLGVMHGGVESVKKNKEFVLLRNKECKFGPGGQADHLAKIFMKEGKTVSYTDETVYVEGTLRIKPSMGEDGNTWSIYEIEGGELK